MSLQKSGGVAKGLVHGRIKGPESITSLVGPFCVMQPSLNNASNI